MKIKLKTLNLITFDPEKRKQFRFVNEMKEDPLINEFVTNRLDYNLLRDKDDTDIEVGASYLITDNKELIGYIRLFELDMSGVLTLHYAVHPDKRKNGYGTKILIEVSDYVLKNVKEIKKVKLDIKDYNKASINCAKKANFKLQTDTINNNRFVYIKSK